MKNTNALLTTVLILFFSMQSLAWSPDSNSRFSFSAYADAYYAYYTDSAGHGDYQKFPTVSPRSNQIGLNIAQVTAQYDGEKIRGIVTLHYGDIPRSTWSSTFNYIQEAHAGVRLAKTLWLDAGLFRTYFGTEGLLPKENIASSVSVNTFYEPYYEAGARLNFIPTDKLSISLYLLNGYNIIEENNNKKSIGMLITYALGDNGNIGYSNYIGDDTPDADSISHTRIHQNLFINCQVSKLKIQVGADYCLQNNSRIHHPEETAKMFSGVAALKLQLSTCASIYGRGEWFNDPSGFMSFLMTDAKGRLTGLELWGATAGLEYKPTEGSYLRLEGRTLQADEDQKIFRWDGNDESSRLEISLNLGVTIQ